MELVRCEILMVQITIINIDLAMTFRIYTVNLLNSKTNSCVVVECAVATISRCNDEDQYR